MARYACLFAALSLLMGFFPMALRIPASSEANNLHIIIALIVFFSGPNLLGQLLSRILWGKKGQSGYADFFNALTYAAGLMPQGSLYLLGASIGYLIYS